MGNRDKQKRIKSWISMLDIFPADSVEGHLRDSYWREKLEDELDGLQAEREPQIGNALRDLPASNQLRRLSK